MLFPPAGIKGTHLSFRYTFREKETHAEWQTDRQTDRQTDPQTDTEREREVRKIGQVNDSELQFFFLAKSDLNYVDLALTTLTCPNKSDGYFQMVISRDNCINICKLSLGSNLIFEWTNRADLMPLWGMNIRIIIDGWLIDLCYRRDNNNKWCYNDINESIRAVAIRQIYFI